jgi:uncharacterized surface protein with fasciclin (FAS1) repeats
MNRKHTVAAGFTAVVLAATATVAAAPGAQAAPSTTDRAGTTSLAAVHAADGHHFDKKWGDFDILDAAVMAVLKEKPKSSVAVLAKGKVRLTAFLPTDRAFQRLAKTLTGKSPKTERATFNTLAKAAGIDVIETVLLYHVVPGKTLGANKVVKADGKKLTTAQGGTVTVKVKGKKVTLVDADPDLANPRVIATDINKGNRQIGHAINRVLLPLDL